MRPVSKLCQYRGYRHQQRSIRQYEMSETLLRDASIDHDQCRGESLNSNGTA